MESSKIRITLGDNSYTIICCSVMGEGKFENQDSFKIYYDENQIIIVVADGLGSAIYSKEGSQKIVSVASCILANNNDLSEVPREMQMKWKDGLEGNLNLYDTTIKFIKITKANTFYGGVGDGWIALNTTEGFVEMTASNSFSNQTDTILSFDLKNKFFINNVATESVKTALISTDGFSEDIEKDDGEQFLSAVSEQILIDSEAFKEEIQETLSHWPVETNKDDKTVVFIERE